MGNGSAKEAVDGHAEPSSSMLPVEDDVVTAGGFVEQEPRLVTPQVPVSPLHWPNDAVPSPNPLRKTGDANSPAVVTALQKSIPTLITWNQGGDSVLVEGSWDNWSSRKALQISGKDHAILLVLPSGIYHYRMIIDGAFRYLPDLPFVHDDNGHLANVLDVNDHVAENLDSVAEFEIPTSPESSYDMYFPGDEDYAKEPPSLPSQLLVSVLGSGKPDEACLRPQHVVMDHLFIEKGWAPQPLLALSLTHRFRTKYVTVLLYKPLRR